MASDNHAAYSCVGFAVLAGVAAIVGTLVYIGGVGNADREFLIETYYDKPVSGLSAGSPVNFRGVKIGEVRAITFTGVRYEGRTSSNDAQRVSIVMAVDERNVGVESHEEAREAFARYVRRGLRATVTTTGITGLSRIELNIPEHPRPLEPLAWKPIHPLVPPQPSLLEGFEDAATKVMNEINAMDLAAVWSNVQQMTDSAAKLTADARATFESQRAGLASIVDNVDRVTSDVGELTRTLKENPSLLLRPSDPEPLPETARE